MSRKHYIAFAKMFASMRDTNKHLDLLDQPVANRTLDVVISEMCDILKADNPRFDVEKFKDAAKAGC